MMTTTNTEPRGWVGCLGCYNAGELVGKWMTADDAELDVPDVCPRCGSDEFDVFDVEGLRHTGGYYGVPQFIADARAVEDHGDPAALQAWADHRGESLADAADTFENAFLGEWDDAEDYAHQFLLDCFPEYSGDGILARYFDLDAFTRDLMLGGDIWTEPSPRGGVYVFDGRA